MAGTEVTAMAIEADVAANPTVPADAAGEATVDAAGKSPKREREEDAAGEAGAAAAKNPKAEEVKDEKKEASLGPKVFVSSVEMFDYFYALLHAWSPNLDINKYEHMVLLDLLKKGHAEPDKKIGAGVEAFEVRHHPVWKSRCFFVRRVDGSVDDFSFRKCVDNIIPLPEEMKVKPGSSGNKAFNSKKSGSRGGRGGGRGGRGRGRRDG